MLEKGKKQLDTIMREKAYQEIKEAFEKQGIDIKNVADEDIEALMQDKIKNMKSTAKGVGIGIGVGLLISAITGF